MELGIISLLERNFLIPLTETFFVPWGHHSRAKQDNIIRNLLRYICRAHPLAVSAHHKQAVDKSDNLLPLFNNPKILQYNSPKTHRIFVVYV